MFSGGVYVEKHTSQASSVRAKASARRGLHLLEKMLAFFRSVSKFFDTLKSCPGPFLQVPGSFCLGTERSPPPPASGIRRTELLSFTNCTAGREFYRGNLSFLPGRSRLGAASHPGFLSGSIAFFQNRPVHLLAPHAPHSGQGDLMEVKEFPGQGADLFPFHCIVAPDRSRPG